MSELSYEIVAKCFRENFHPGEVTINIRKREDSPNILSVLITDNFSRKQKEFIIGQKNTINDLQDMCLTAAKLFGYVWSVNRSESA